MIRITTKFFVISVLGTLCISYVNARIGGYSHKNKQPQSAPSPNQQQVAQHPPVPVPYVAAPQSPQQGPVTTPNQPYFISQGRTPEEHMQAIETHNKHLRDQIALLEKESYHLQKENRQLMLDKQRLQKKKRDLVHQVESLEEKLLGTATYSRRVHVGNA